MKALRSFTIVIPLDPEAAARARVARNGHHYNPQRQLITRLRIYIDSQFNGPMLGQHPLELSATFYFGRPKAHAKMKNPPRYKSSRPDLDNLEKLIGDCCNGIIYQDDAIICKNATTKEYCDDDKPRTIFTFTEIE